VQETKEPINKAACHEKIEVVAATQLEDGGVTGMGDGGAAELEDGAREYEACGYGHAVMGDIHDGQHQHVAKRATCIMRERKEEQ
jgi:hypothetical protein